MISVSETTVKLVAATAPKSDLGRPGEAGPGDGDRGAPGRRARGGRDAVIDGADDLVGEHVTRHRGAGPAGRGHVDPVRRRAPGPGRPR